MISFCLDSGRERRLNKADSTTTALDWLIDLASFSHASIRLSGMRIPTGFDPVIFLFNFLIDIV